MLLLATGVVLLSFVLQVRPDGRVALPGLAQYPLPETCLAQLWFGRKCPGCGLTRSFIFLAHADGPASWRMHRLGWLLALAVLLQFPYRLLALARPGRPPLPVSTCRLFGTTLIVLLVGNWLLEVLGMAR
jgi:hypothetical protein